MEKSSISEKTQPSGWFQWKLMPPTNWGAVAILLPRVVDCKKNLQKSDVNDISK
jgi:hypothetical protein